MITSTYIWCNVFIIRLNLVFSFVLFLNNDWPITLPLTYFYLGTFKKCFKTPAKFIFIHFNNLNSKIKSHLSVDSVTRWRPSLSRFTDHTLSFVPSGVELLALYNHPLVREGQAKYYTVKVPLRVQNCEGGVKSVEANWLDHMTQHFNNGATLVDGYFYLGNVNGKSFRLLECDTHSVQLSNVPTYGLVPQTLSLKSH